MLLTFDDWAFGDPDRATRIGAYPQSRNLRAAVFLINQYAQASPGILATLRQQGHRVLHHTSSHPNLTTLSDASVSWQLRTGSSSNRPRPPYGASNSRVATTAANLGSRICTWTIDTKAWQTPEGVRYRSTASLRYLVRTSPGSAKASGWSWRLSSNHPSAVSGMVCDLHQQGLLFCRNRGPVGRLAPFPLACT